MAREDQRFARYGGVSAKVSRKFGLPSGEIVQAELHWYEATGIGKREMKVKAFIVTCFDSPRRLARRLTIGSSDRGPRLC